MKYFVLKFAISAKGGISDFKGCQESVDAKGIGLQNS